MLNISKVKSEIKKQIEHQLSRALEFSYISIVNQKSKDMNRWQLKRWVLGCLTPHYMLDISTSTYRENKFRVNNRSKARRYRRIHGNILNKILKNDTDMGRLIALVSTNLYEGKTLPEKPYESDR